MQRVTPVTGLPSAWCSSKGSKRNRISQRGREVSKNNLLHETNAASILLLGWKPS